MIPENLARSIKDRLSTLSRQLGVPFPKLMTEFLLERLAARLLESSDLSDRLIFKGGYVSLRVYHSPRYTVDLDALLRHGTLDTITESVRPLAERDLGDGVWFRFEKTIDLETQGEYGGLRLVFRAGTGKLSSDLRKAQIIQLDIGKGDPVIPRPMEVETPFLLGGGALSWRVYPVETTVAEKLHALIVRGSASSRAKDIFDLNLLLPQCDSSHLKAAVTETFRHRGEMMPNNLVSVLSGIDRTLLKMGWKSAAVDFSPAPDFDKEFEGIIANLARIGL